LARLTRKELKSDKFALEVQHSVEFVSEHRQQLIRWGGIGAAVAVLVVAFVVYRNHEHGVRQEALHHAMQVQNASVGNQSSEFMLTFPTEADRLKAAVQAFTEVVTKYPGTDEAAVAQFFLGTNAVDAGNIPEAEKRFQLVIDSGNTTYGSLAKLALAQLFASEGKRADGEKLIQSAIDHPSNLVSKEEATLALGRLLQASDPSRARKLLEPLRSSPRSSISRAAITAVSELPEK